MRDVLRALAPYVSLALHRSFTCRPYLTEFQKSQNWGLRHGRTSRIFLSCAKAQPSAAMQSLGCRLMAGQRILVPSMGVRLPPSQPLHLLHMARSSSGLGRRPLKAEITSSNLVRATTSFLLRLMARSSSGLERRPLKAEITSSNLVRATTHLIPGLPMEGRVFYFQTTVCNSRLNQSFAFCLWSLRVQYPRYFDC